MYKAEETKIIEGVKHTYAPDFEFNPERVSAIEHPLGEVYLDADNRPYVASGYHWYRFDRTEWEERKNEPELTEVVLRKYPKGDIIALFPYDISDLQGNVTCYQHVGQHSGADYGTVIAQTVPATAAEAKDLITELQSLSPEPYRLKVIRRRNYGRYLQEYYAARKQD
jgi:hypothetical protein